MNSTTEGLAKKTGTLDAVVELLEREGMKRFHLLRRFTVKLKMKLFKATVKVPESWLWTMDLSDEDTSLLQSEFSIIRDLENQILPQLRPITFNPL